MKKRVCILLAILMLAMTVSSVSAASFPDTEGKTCETAADVLFGLGIVEGNEKGEYTPDKVLTRAEMTAIILRSINTPEGVGKAIFKDVPSSHWAYATVSAAYQKGIINGMDENTFAPDASVTYEQAVKMVVCALGYDVQAKAMGGYPTGYLAIASQLDITKGVSNESPMKRGDMANLLYNALDVPLFERASYGEDSFDYEEGDTMLSAFHKVTLRKGVVNAAPMMQIATPSEVLAADEAELADGTIVKRGNTNVQALVGMKADVYTRYDEELGKVVAIAAVPTKDTEEIVVNGKDVEGATATEFKYVDDNGVVRQRNIAGAQLIYNGKPMAMDPTKLDPAIGTVRLVSAGSQIDYIFVEEFVNGLVTSVNAKDKKISYKNAAGVLGNIIVDEEDITKANVILDATGKELALSDVEKQMVISIAKSEDNAIAKILTSVAVKEGEVTELNASRAIAKIAGSDYSVDANVLSAMEVGMKATFRLDAMGNIAFVDSTTVDDGTMYGWLAEAYVTRGVNGTSYFKVFNEKGEWVTYKAAERFELNGAPKTRTELNAVVKGEASAGLGREPLYRAVPYTWMEAGGIVPQLIRFEVKGENEISVLETAQNLTAYGTSEAAKLAEEFSMDYYTVKDYDGVNGRPALAEFNYVYRARADKDVVSPSGKYSPGEFVNCVGYTLYGKYRVDDSFTVVFELPDDLSLEDNYKVTPASKLFTPTNYAQVMDNVATYDLNDKNQIKAVVVHNYFRSTPGSEVMGATMRARYLDGSLANTLAGMVTATGESLDADGETVKSLEIIDWSGKAHTVNYEDGQYLGYYGANSDYKNDPDWIWFNGASRIIGAGETNRGNGDVSDSTEMLIPISAIDVGDVIVWEANSRGFITAGGVSWRSNYPGETGLREKAGSVTQPTAMSDAAFGIGTIDCVVTDVTEYGIMAEYETIGTNGNKNGIIAERTYDVSSAKCYSFDLDRQEMKEITADDFSVGDNMLVLINGRTIKMVVIYE